MTDPLRTWRIKLPNKAGPATTNSYAVMRWYEERGCPVEEITGLVRGAYCVVYLLGGGK
jgi:hypothetical protein